MANIEQLVLACVAAGLAILIIFVAIILIILFCMYRSRISELRAKEAKLETLVGRVKSLEREREEIADQMDLMKKNNESGAFIAAMKQLSDQNQALMRTLAKHRLPVPADGASLVLQDKAVQAKPAGTLTEDSLRLESTAAELAALRDTIMRSSKKRGRSKSKNKDPSDPTTTQPLTFTEPPEHVSARLVTLESQLMDTAARIAAIDVSDSQRIALHTARQPPRTPSPPPPVTTYVSVPIDATRPLLVGGVTAAVPSHPSVTADHSAASAMLARAAATYRAVGASGAPAGVHMRRSPADGMPVRAPAAAADFFDEQEAAAVLTAARARSATALPAAGPLPFDAELDRSKPSFQSAGSAYGGAPAITTTAADQSTAAATPSYTAGGTGDAYSGASAYAGGSYSSYTPAATGAFATPSGASYGVTYKTGEV